MRVKRTKSEKPRKFRLPQDALAALRFQRERQDTHKNMFGASYKAGLDLIFCRPDGSFLDPALVSQTIVRRAKKAGLENVSLHNSRHTHASALLSAKTPLPAVSARLGHANTNITATIYAHAIPADDDDAAAAWDRYSSGGKLQ